MTKDHLVEEKTSLQKSLLYYESQHGRPVMSLPKKMRFPVLKKSVTHFCGIDSSELFDRAVFPVTGELLVY